MNRYFKDIIFVLGVVIFFLPFFLIEEVFVAYSQFNIDHPLIMSFLKFAVLATLGEVIGLRIRKSIYWEKGFGLMSRAIVWGFLGITIKAAFVVFASGVPIFLEKMGVEGIVASMKGDFSTTKLLAAFSISAAMNLVYAPVMMTLHRITDTHILFHGGQVSCLVKRINFGKILKEMDWGMQWNFVFKKTIPFFWIPAHTITFLMAAEYQVLFAALLGIVLGVLLAIASPKPKTKG
ncbi:hypothetical protein [Carboxylicivirga sp. N1Y90]|uniref:hypothetical protein n=1 Tax=Carboxylicivirga fragile TaxID=3417571 RepID=UPI003D33E24E|nr:hypothetical protein [Marinilabiliaceae bacterium N1Y90]